MHKQTLSDQAHTLKKRFDKECHEAKKMLYHEFGFKDTENYQKHLGLEVLSCLEVGKRAYYAFENIFNHGENKCWVLKKYIFDI